MDNHFNISDKIKKLSETAMSDIIPQFQAIDAVAQKNTEKVLAAFQRCRVSDSCFAGTTGYGYNDKGREVLDLLFSDVMGTESSLVRTGFVSGTHAITAALFASVSPGQTLLSVTGLPYDTLHGVIGIKDRLKGSLKDYGISYSQVDLKENGEPAVEPSRVSGQESTDWIILDYDSVLVHIFNSEARDYYKLEKLWGDGGNIDVDGLLELKQD